MAWGSGGAVVQLPAAGPALALLGVIFLEHAIVGGNNPVTGLAFSIVYALIAGWLSASRSGRATLHSLPVPAAALLVLCLLQGAAMPLMGLAVDPAAALQETVKLAALGCVFLVASAYAPSADRLMRWMVRLGCLYLLAFLGSHFLLPETLLGVEKFTALGRFTGSFVSANTAASLAGMLLIIAAGSLIHLQRAAAQATPLWWRRLTELLQYGLAELLVIVMASGALVLTVSRAGIALGFLGVAALSLWQALAERKVRGALSPVLAVAAPMLAALAIGGQALVQRLGSTAEAASLRGEVFQVHWRIFEQAPVFGHGLGGFSLLNREAAEPRNFELLSTVHAAHNLYLQWLEQAGVVGAGLMFGAIALVLGPIARAAFSPQRSSLYLRAVVVISAMLLIHGLVDYALEVPSIAAFWTLLLGLAYGEARASRQTGTTFAAGHRVASARNGAPA